MTSYLDYCMFCLHAGTLSGLTNSNNHHFKDNNIIQPMLKCFSSKNIGVALKQNSLSTCRNNKRPHYINNHTFTCFSLTFGDNSFGRPLA